MLREMGESRRASPNKTDLRNMGPPKGGSEYEALPTFPGDPDDVDTYKKALQRLSDMEQVRARKLQEQRMRADRTGVHPEILRFTELMYKRMDKAGIPVFAHELWRSPQRQAQLKKDGMSRLGTSLAPHPRGLAVDIVHSVHGWNMSPLEWNFFGHVGKELAIQRGIAIEWGGDWKDPNPDDPLDVGWDPAHWQLRDWKALADQYPFPEVKK